jgi:protein TonB
LATPWEGFVRCEHCHDKTADDRRRFCEWCGRQLSVREENPVETATAALDDLIDASTAPHVVAAGTPAETPADTPVETVSSAPPSARCESCGGPADDADLCDACQRAFHAVIESRKPEPSVDREEDETEEDEFDDDEFEFPEPAQAQVSPLPEPAAPGIPVPAATAPQIAVAANPWAASPSFSTPTLNASSAPAEAELPERPPIGFAPLPPPMAPAAVAAAAAAAVAAAPETETSAPAPAPAPQAAPPPVAVRQPVPARELTRPMPRPRPVPPGGLPKASPPASGGRTRALFVGGALVVVALAICVPLASPWLATEEQAAPPREEPVQEPPAQVAAARPAPAREPVVDNFAPDPEPPRPVRQPKPVRQEPRREAPAPAPAIEAMSEATLPAAEPVAAPAPEPEPAAAPVGPFFETRQVNETPQIASRIEPRIPDDVQGPINDVVIVRVLVSQTGQASLVSVLRRSRTGVSLDDAVVAAVKQWTFSPARKRGEAVSCWYHVGVPIQRAG